MLASPGAAIVPNDGLHRRAELASLSSSYSQYIHHVHLVSMFTKRNRVKYFGHDRRDLSGMPCVPSCGSCCQSQAACGEHRMGFLVQLQPVRHTGPDGVVSVPQMRHALGCSKRIERRRGEIEKGHVVLRSAIYTIECNKRFQVVKLT